jgi:hypothetical protein
MTLTISALARSFVWAFAGSLVYAVILFPYGGQGGLVGLQFMVGHTAALYVVGLILYSYPTVTTPIYMRFAGLRGLESAIIFLLAIELALFGVVAAVWIAGLIIGFFGWWTGQVGSAWGVAHFLTSAALFLYFYNLRNTVRTSWLTPPIALSLFLLLVPFIYEGKFFF